MQKGKYSTMGNPYYEIVKGRSLIKKKNYRFFVAGNYISILSFFGHALNILFFLLLGVYALAYYNIFSCLCWAGIFFLNRKGFHKTSFYIGLLELISYVFLTVLFLGWTLGFYYFIFCYIPFIFFIPSRRYILKAFGSFLLISYFVFLYYFSRIQKPFMIPDPLIKELFHNYNAALTLLTIALTSYFYSKAARDAESALDKEHERSEILIRNILPESIANRLKNNPESIAEKHNEVSILFLDIVGFTPLSRTITPEQLVNLLNGIFSVFDDLSEKYGLEKIKTIGDSYMVAAGLPESQKDHAQRISKLALDMRRALEEYRKKNNISLSVRIGINSGAVVAGVIGKKKFSCDLWGDTVNTASRMESHGISGEIQISQSTYELIKDTFICEKRGSINIKGIGQVNTYLLKGLHHS